MNSLIALNFALLFFIATRTAHAQVQQQVSEHLIIQEDIKYIHIRLPKKDVEIKSTKGSRILLEAKITLAVDNVGLLAFFVQSGRYNFAMQKDEIQETIEIMNLAPSKGVLIKKGKEIEETIKYTIYVPANQLNKIKIGLIDFSMLSALD